MKGKGIQVTNKAYRDGWERTFRKDSEIPSLLDSLRDVNSYRKELLKMSNEERASWVKANFIERTEVCVEDIDAIVDSSGYCSVHESYHCECYRPTKKRPLMDSWVLDINHFEGLD